MELIYLALIVTGMTVWTAGMTVLFIGLVNTRKGYEHEGHFYFGEKPMVNQPEAGPAEDLRS